MKESKNKFRKEYNDLFFHDILNLLNRLIIRNELGKEYKKDPEALSKLLEENEKEHKTIIAMLRNYRRVLAGEEPEWTNVEKLFKEIVFYFPDLKERNVKVNYSLKDKEDSSLILFLKVDPRFFSVLFTITDNFIKYGGEKMTEINLSYKNEEDGLRLVLENNGEGIPQKLKERIFEKDFGGKGLYLTRKVLEDYGFTIKEEGQPTKEVRFVISIPKPTPKPTRKIP